MIDVVDGAPLVVAANRDELYARPTRPPELIVPEPRIAGGVDELSGGTWLALRADGRFAAVTNQRALATPPPGLRSRGLAVLELAASADPDAYVAAIDPAGYASMNLIWGDARGVKIVYTRREERTLETERLGRGVHVLCNDRLGAPGFPRGERLHATIEDALEQGVTWPALAARLAIALGDHTRVALADTPPSHLPAELAPPRRDSAEVQEDRGAREARELTATCIHSEHYGTRSSTIIAAAPGRVIAYLHADGPPCTTDFVERRALLEATG